MPITTDDIYYLKRTLVLARRGLGRTAPNPAVGAVVVQDGVIVGEGYHPQAGQPHAEIFALRAADEQAQGATVYVSLEPCAHFGKTPPCAEALIAARVARVVFASLDPNPLVAGRGAARLKQAGITVEYGAQSDEEARLNEAWRYWMRTGLPFVTLKLAASLDGRIATSIGESQWITGERARRDVHRLRATQDAILTTADSVLADDPALTARLSRAHNPRRVVVDARLRTSPSARVYDTDARPPLLATLVSDVAALAPYVARGVEPLILAGFDGHVDLSALMVKLGELEVASLLIETGGRFAAALTEAELVNKVRWYVAPLLIGGQAATPALAGQGVAHLADAPRLRDVRWTAVGEDMRVEGYLKGEG